MNYSADKSTSLAQQFDGQNMQHAFLFDPHGPAGKLQSSLYFPLWQHKKLSPKVGGDTSGKDDTSGKAVSLRNSDGIDIAELFALQASQADEPSPEAILLVGESASYDNVDELPEGIHRLELIVGSETSLGSLIILDSCWGSADITSAIPQRSSPVLTFTADSQIYFNAIQYQKLSGTQYAALPMLAQWSASNEALKSRLESLRANLATRGLDQQPIRTFGTTGKIEIEFTRMRMTYVAAK